MARANTRWTKGWMVDNDPVSNIVDDSKTIHNNDAKLAVDYWSSLPLLRKMSQINGKLLCFMKYDDVTTGLLLSKCDESLKDCHMLNKKMQLKSTSKIKAESI